MATRNIRDINQSKAAKILEDITRNQLLNNCNLVFANDNKISAFGIYHIVKTEQTYKIFKRNVYTLEINTVQAAMSWCIADKYCIPTLKDKLIKLDAELVRRKTDLIFYRNIINSTADYEAKCIILDRITDCKDRFNLLKKQLTKCVNSAKYCQQKGFDNETSRLGFQKPY